MQSSVWFEEFETRHIRRTPGILLGSAAFDDW